MSIFFLGTNKYSVWLKRRWEEEESEGSINLSKVIKGKHKSGKQPGGGGGEVCKKLRKGK